MKKSLGIHIFSILFLTAPIFAADTQTVVDESPHLPAVLREFCLSTLSNIIAVGKSPDSPVRVIVNTQLQMPTNQEALEILEAEFGTLADILGLDLENASDCNETPECRTLKIQIPEVDLDRANPLPHETLLLIASRIKLINEALQTNPRMVGFGVWGREELYDFANRLRMGIQNIPKIPLPTWRFESAEMEDRGKMAFPDGLMVQVAEGSKDEILSRYTFSVWSSRALLTVPLFPLAMGAAAGGVNMGHGLISAFIGALLIKKGILVQAFRNSKAPSTSFWKRQTGVLTPAATRKTIEQATRTLATEINNALELPQSVTILDTEVPGLHKGQVHHLINFIYYRDGSPRILIFHFDRR